MRAFRILSAVILGCWSSLMQALPFLLGGIQINEPDQERWLYHLQHAGMNTVEVTVYAMQGGWNTAHLWYDSDKPYVEAEIKAAKDLGMHVVLVLRVALDHAFSENKYYWHGMIMPERNGQVQQWFLNYGGFVHYWAGRSEELGVDVLAIGSELRLLTATLPTEQIPGLEAYYLDTVSTNAYLDRQLHHADAIEQSTIWSPDKGSLTAHLQAKLAAHRHWAHVVTFGQNLKRVNRRRALLHDCWGQLIDEVRAVYSGNLTYAANFDNYHRVGFWDQLDWVGINAYFPLRHEIHPWPAGTIAAEMEASWEAVFRKMSTRLKNLGVGGHPVLFTELGYTRYQGM